MIAVPFHWEGRERAIHRNCSTEVIVWDITAKVYNTIRNKSSRMKINYFLQSFSRIETYKTLRLERLVSSLGIDPVSLLLFSRLYHRFDHIITKFHAKCKLWKFKIFQLVNEKILILTEIWLTSIWPKILGFLLQICFHTNPC